MFRSLSILVGALIASTTELSAQEACSDYVVEPGDTLGAIAESAYDNASFQLIWDANRTLLGDSPNNLDIGDVLRLPCIGPEIANDQAEPVEQGSPLEIRLVTGSNYPPFTDESMEEGGVYTQLVKAALGTLGPNADTPIVFVNDWGSHLDYLLPSGAFDGAFPWLRPNCEEPQTLTENSSFRCNEFLHTESFFSTINALTVNAGSSLISTDEYDDFHGKTICLPESYTDALLASRGLTEPIVTFSRPVNPDDCFHQLAAGDVDAISLEQVQTTDAIQRLGYEGRFFSNERLIIESNLTVFVSKNNPDGPEIVALLNQGLENIRESGVWLKTVQSGFRTYYENPR